MESQGFQNLKVWAKAHNLVLHVYRLTKQFPQEEKFCLVNQIRRSTISIGANISEGYKKSKKEFLRYLDIAQASLEETKYHLLLSADLGYISSKEYANISDLTDEVGKMLTGLRKSLLIHSPLTT